MTTPKNPTLGRELRMLKHDLARAQKLIDKLLRSPKLDKPSQYNLLFTAEYTNLARLLTSLPTLLNSIARYAWLNPQPKRDDPLLTKIFQHKIS